MPTAHDLKKKCKRNAGITQATNEFKQTSVVISLHTDICCTPQVLLLKIYYSENTYHTSV